VVSTARLSLAAGGVTLGLDDYLVRSPLGGAAVLDNDDGLTGLDLPPQSPRFFVGSGDGQTYRGSRVTGRDIPLSVMLTATDYPSLKVRASTLARILDPRNAPATLTYAEPDGTAWDIRVVRSDSKRTGTDRETWLTLDLTLTAAGDPLWTREAPSTLVVRAAGAGRGLLRPGGSLSELRLASGQVIGTVNIENDGDAEVKPVTILHGPATTLSLISPAGETISWEGSLDIGEVRIFDHAAGTVTDAAGTNCYPELGPAPRFWAIPPGLSVATANAEGTDAANSSVVFSWRPRRWLML
jgi:hypothetical protein